MFVASIAKDIGLYSYLLKQCMMQEQGYSFAKEVLENKRGEI